MFKSLEYRAPQSPQHGETNNSIETFASFQAMTCLQRQNKGQLEVGINCMSIDNSLAVVVTHLFVRAISKTSAGLTFDMLPLANEFYSVWNLLCCG